MREIDKLVSRAFPDELRRVAPIPVNEKAVLARTLDKLGLEARPDRKPVLRKRARPRYVGRHRQKPEPLLVEMAQDPPRHRWAGWLGWAAAACIMVAAAVNFGPYLLQGMGTAPASQGEDRGYIRSVQEEKRALMENYSRENQDDQDGPAPSAGPALSGSPAPAPSAGTALSVSSDQRKQAEERLTAGIESAALNMFRLESRIRVAGVSLEPDPVSNSMEHAVKCTFAVSFPGVSANEISLYDLNLSMDNLATYQTARENKDGLAYVTFRILLLDSLEFPSDSGLFSINYVDDAIDSSFLVYYMGLDLTNTTCELLLFSEEDYATHGYASMKGSGSTEDNEGNFAGVDNDGGWATDASPSD